MAKTVLLVEKLKDWAAFYPAELLMTPDEFLVNWEEKKDNKSEKIKVINLCRNYKYQSNGYYCSLLSEARGYSVIPSTKTIYDLAKSFIYQMEDDEIQKEIERSLKLYPKDKPYVLKVYFGKTEQIEFEDLARQVFDHFAAPILEIEISFNKSWEISSIKPVGLNILAAVEQTYFAKALDEYSAKIWRKPKTKKRYRYDLAILHNPKELMPPSDKKALQNFIKAGKQLDVQIELIEKRDFNRIAEFDALFIRETTSLNHYTYRFAQKAESENLVVIDDPTSILKCTNKIFLVNILQSQKIDGLKTIIVSKNNPQSIYEASAALGFPFVIKIPDGSFSKGVFKIENSQELEKLTEELFKKTSLLLFQEYFYSDYDWRIGVFGDRVYYACKYFMTKNHWQIYNHNIKSKNSKPATGDSETLPISKVPKHVIQTALKVSGQIGNGFYGVDIKERDNNAYVIEVNDNPSIDDGIEDGILGQDLYYNIIQEFVRRIELR